MRLLAVLLAASLSACATVEPKPLTLPDLYFVCDADDVLWTVLKYPDERLAHAQSGVCENAVGIIERVIINGTPKPSKKITAKSKPKGK